MLVEKINVNKKTICLRAETKANEYRTPLVPKDAAKLLKKNCRVLVEKSSYRCFKDEDYKKIGCEIVKTGAWQSLAPSKNTWILGLKGLPEKVKEITGQHIFFGHAFKGQKGASDLLLRFKNGNGVLFDLEYLQDENKRRLAAFGYWAGYAGAALALIHFLSLQAKTPNPLKQLYPLTRDFLEKKIKELLPLALAAKAKPSVLVIGAKGRCGRGAIDVFKHTVIEPILWDQEETQVLNKKTILKQDILLNCVFVTQPCEPFLTLEDLEKPKNLSLICDITCDLGSRNNLLPIYEKTTTWREPILSIADKLELIALDNLPSLLPKASSLDFSQNLTPLLLSLENKTWQRCNQHFASALENLKQF